MTRVCPPCGLAGQWWVNSLGVIAIQSRRGGRICPPYGAREKGPQRGPFCMRHDLHVVRAVLDDHHLLGVMVIAPAEMMAAVMAALDDDLLDRFRLRGLDRRRDERDCEHGGERHGDVLHKVLLWVQSRHR